MFLFYCNPPSDIVQLRGEAVRVARDATAVELYLLSPALNVTLLLGLFVARFISILE
jgi:flagellar biosynthesis protein FliQ